MIDEDDVHPDPLIIAFSYGPSPNPTHECDHDGPSVDISDGRCTGESSSCSVCGSTYFDRSYWED